MIGIKFVDHICKHLIESGLDVHPPWHDFGAKQSKCAIGAARVYCGRAGVWLGFSISEHIVDIQFFTDSLEIKHIKQVIEVDDDGKHSFSVFGGEACRVNVFYSDEDYIAKIYAAIIAAANDKHANEEIRAKLHDNRGKR